MSMYKNFIDCIECIIDCIESGQLEFVKYSYVFGSVSKRLISDTSDLDLLLLGTEPKDINLISSITMKLDNCNITDIDIDVKYYSIDEFLKLKSTNLFLKNIEMDCIGLEELKDELLRLC
ncbi:MAG: hypothetical protein ACRC5M_02490 [Anaeroplasmataceae bacterium]